MAERPPETILSSPTFKLTGKGEKPGEYAKFGWQYAFGSINATYFSGAKEGNNRFFNVKMSVQSIQMYCNELISASLPGPYHIPEGWEMKLYQGKGSDEKHIGTLIVGKDEDGQIWTAISKDGYYKVKFLFGLPMGVRVGRLGGAELSKAEISSMRARAHAEKLAEAAILVWGENFDPNEGNSFNDRKTGGSYSGGGGGKPGRDDDMDEAVTSSGW